MQRNRDVRFFQRNCIVDAIADETDRRAVRLQPLDDFRLARWQNLGKVMLDAQLFRQRGGHLLMVAR